MKTTAKLMLAFGSLQAAAKETNEANIWTWGLATQLIISEVNCTVLEFWQWQAAKEAAKEPKEAAKEAAKEPKEAAKEAAKEPKEAAKEPKEAAKEPKEAAKEPKEAAKETKDEKPAEEACGLAFR